MTDITLSDTASAHLQAKIAEKKGVGFRISIKKTGCSGFSYVPTIISDIQANDILIAKSNLNVYLDAEWIALLAGVHVDYIEENKNGLKQKQLTITHPNETARCGCGESFHVEKS